MLINSLSGDRIESRTMKLEKLIDLVIDPDKNIDNVPKLWKTVKILFESDCNFLVIFSLKFQLILIQLKIINSHKSNLMER